MDRLNQIRGEAGSSRDLTLDTTSPPSEAFMTANESSSKYFTLSEVDSTFSISPSKESLAAGSADSDRTITTDSELISNLSPIPKKSDLDSYKIGKQIEAANILSGGVDIFDDNDNSYDGDELVIDDNVIVDDDKGNAELKLNENSELPLDKGENLDGLEDTETIPSKDTEVVLQIDGKNVDAIDIGNGLYLYRKAGKEELAAVQIIDDDQQQPSFKFLKVRENAEGNLEVYEEIEIEIPKEVPTKEGNPAGPTSSHVPIKDITKMINEPSGNKVADRIHKTPKNESNVNNDVGTETNVELQTEVKTEVNLNGKMMKFNESRKSPLIGTYTPMTYHSTPNKEGIPLTKTMVDQQLHPSRHSDNIKKTIEVHTDSCRQKLWDTPIKNKDSSELPKTPEAVDESQTTTEAVVEDQTTTESVVETPIVALEDVDVKQSDDKTVLQDVDSVTVSESTKVEDQIDESNPIANKIDNLVETKEDDITKMSEEEIPSKEEEKEKEEDIDTEHVSVEESVSKNDVSVEDNIDKSTVDNIKEPISNELECIQDKEAQSDLVVNKESEVVQNDIETLENDIIKDNVLPERTEENCVEAKLEDKPLIGENVVENIDEKQKEDSSTENLNKIDEVEDSKVINDLSESDKQPVEETSPTDEVKNDVNVEENKVENILDEVTEKSSNKITETPVVVTSIIPFNRIDDSKEDIVIIEKVSSTDAESNLKNDEAKTASIHTIETTKAIPEKIEDKFSEDVSTNCMTELKTENKEVENKFNLKEDEKSDIKIKNVEAQNELREGNREVNTLIPVEKKKTEFVAHLKEAVSQSVLINTDKVKNDIETSKPIGKETKNTNLVLNTKKIVAPKTNIDKNKIEAKPEIIKPKVVTSVPINNNHSAVPFGKWTSANRQEFLNKIKETKIPSNNSNTKQLKQPNDLNRRDVLKKIDSQRQSATGSAKAGDSGNASKLTSKVEVPAFVNKTNVNQNANKQDVKVTAVKTQPTFVKEKPVVSKKVPKEETVDPVSAKIHRKEINNQDLIDKTIEGIINRAITGKSATENTDEKPTNVTEKNENNTIPLDDIEKKMNELHGNPYEERTQHEVNSHINNEAKSKPKAEIVKVDKNSKIPNLVPFKNKDHHVVAKDKEVEELSDEEIIEHVPITGDIDVTKPTVVSLPPNKDRTVNESRKEAIITEKDFDKFARRNSITYENCLTMSFDGKEPHNVIQTVVEKEPPVKKLSRNELMLAQSKAKSTIKQHNIAMRHNNQLSKIPTSVKLANEEDTFTKNYQSRVQIAYQSVLTAKRNLECPITIIEDKPVKVLYMDSNMEFTPTQLNVQGQELSPPKKQASESSDGRSASESLDSDIIESHNDNKPHDETKFKIKHQRKQVLTPVEEPELELIEPDELGIEVSPKKKRKLEDKTDKVSKTLVPKKSYLLNRNIIDDVTPKPQHLAKTPSKETENQNETFKSHSDAISAIDNLVKAAELIETQAEQKHTVKSVQSVDNSPNTPIKRGRGRPRKYPISEQGAEVKAPTPQKKPRLIDAKVTKSFTDSDDSSDGEIIKENWTMGKINENIVCPICNKLFRSENVVFKHVKHCTGPSPNRSDSDKRSPIRLRRSSERKSSESRSDFSDDDYEEEKVRSRKSRHYTKSSNDNDDVILIEDTPIKERLEKAQRLKILDLKKKDITKSKLQHNSTNNLICEFCGKTFRQLSYLVNHKLQHKKEDLKPSESEVTKSIFSCEVCKKEFRKPHHLVHHRIIHNSNTIATRLLRKSSSEQHDATKSVKNQNDTKQSDDPSAGFRCEPCDKSFRKLHHLVEHRETHDCINKKGTSNAQTPNESTKPSLAHCCDICKKVFKKLQDYLEHREQHFETSSEKSDDKSVKSSLSTKDIIHECSLCYMVFPNEHSLNKHTVICLRKKKQSLAKQAAKKTEEEELIDAEECKTDENILHDVEPNKEEHDQKSEDCQIIKNPIQEVDISLEHKPESPVLEKLEITPANVTKDVLENEIDHPEIKPKVAEVTPKKTNIEQPKENSPNDKKLKDNIEHPIKIKNPEIKEIITIEDTPTPKKKLPKKEKVAPTVTKRHKTANAPLPVIEKPTPTAESSDEDEVRYMLNPNFKEDDCSEGKLFMKVRAKKRNSLQIERPNSKDLIKRRISLQHPPKIPRLKAKAVEPRPLNSITVEKKLKLSKSEVLPGTDSDDSDVKYSFPIDNTEEVTSKEVDKKSKKQSLATKRKSLSGIAKRKSMGKHKLATPTSKPKKRTTEPEHRCDCGQLFSSAALLSRHTTLAHTPPRIRRRRSPAPEPRAPPRAAHKKPRADEAGAAPKLGGRRSGAGGEAQGEPAGKKLRSSAHRGVPVPDKMRKLMERARK